jgi:hypothetical protein
MMKELFRWRKGLRHMSSRAWKVIAAVFIMTHSTGVWGETLPTYDELKAMVDGPWHHVPNAVSSLQFNKDEAKCRVISAQTPANSTTVSVVERVRWAALVNCLTASGYEPGAAATKTMLSNDSTSKLAALRFDDYSCADIARLRKTSPMVDTVFFVWARGLISGWNASAEKPILKVDPAAMRTDDQLKFIRSFCDGNPSKLYLAGVMELLAKLKSEKVKATGEVEEQ